MVFPLTPLDAKVEMNLGGTWTDITQWVKVNDSVTITRGRADEAGETAPSECRLTLDNRDGRFSPRNPVGAYYGLIGRNTPLRVSVRLGATRLMPATAALTYAASTPDSAGLSIVGDLDLRADASMASWVPNEILVGKAVTAGGQYSYLMFVNPSGIVVLNWSADGTVVLNAASTVALPQQTGRQTVRATLDVDNGAAGRTITFYTAPTIAGPWTQLGSPVVQAGTTSIFDSTAPLSAGRIPSAEIYAIEVRQGIGGTIRANPDFTIQAEGATSFSDGTNTWTVAGTASITSRRYRFYGEVSNWPAEWNISGQDVRVPVTAAGILRRLGQGASPLQSATRRGVPVEANLVAYWPMEDDEGSTSLASAVSGASPMGIGVAGVEMAADSQFLGSAPLPAINGAQLGGYVPVSPPGTIVARCAFVIPAAGTTNGAVIMRVYTTGSVASTWDLVYSTASGGSLNLTAYNSAGAVVLGPSPASSAVNGVRHQAALTLTTSGANLSSQLITVNIDTDVGAVAGGPLASATVGSATSVWVNPNAVAMGATAVGHVHVFSALPINPYGFENYLRGWVPETPGRRIERLCSEEAIAFTARGQLGPASVYGGATGAYQSMGAQTTDKLLDLIGQVVATDLGLLVEPRTALGLAYRTRESIYSQGPAALAVDYGNLVDLRPVEDDQNVRNDITVSRSGGSSARARLETGALSVLPPPAGIGVYDDEVTLSIGTDDALLAQASWRLHLGTIDEPRFPGIRLTLESAAFAASASLTAAALDLDQGDLFTVANPPAWMPPNQIRQLAQGLTETFDLYSYEITVNCTPASSWEVGTWDDGGDRYSSDGTSLAEDLDTTETGIDVSTPSGPVWTQDPGEYPLDLVVGGERMTATACSGAGTAQTFTVTRSVNGVVKTHLTGAVVDLFEPAYYAL